MTSPKKSLRPRHLTLVLIAFAAATACGSTASNPSTGVPDSGSGTDSATVFDATQPSMDVTTGGDDVQSIFGDDSGGTDSTTGDSSGGDDATGDASDDADDASDDAGDDASGDDASTKDSGPAVDAGCVAVSVPTSTSGTCTFTTTSCAPGSLAGFTPTAPTPVKQAICATSEITNYYNGCLSPTSTNATCQAATVSMPCYECLVTPQTAGAWGPLVATTNTLVQINVGGCLDLTEPCNHACAVAVNDDLQCEQASCAANCPITDAASETAFNGCAETVDACGANGCGSYFAGTECTSQITGPGTTCTQEIGSDAQFKAAFLAIAPLFCGM